MGRMMGVKILQIDGTWGDLAQRLTGEDWVWSYLGMSCRCGFIEKSGCRCQGDDRDGSGLG